MEESGDWYLSIDVYIVSETCVQGCYILNLIKICTLDSVIEYLYREDRNFLHNLKKKMNSKKWPNE